METYLNEIDFSLYNDGLKANSLNKFTNNNNISYYGNSW